MLKILKIKTKGYRFLEDNFELDFVNESRVTESSENKEIIKIDEGLYTFNSLAFVGSNASGKSTILTLILKTYNFLSSGRWYYRKDDYSGESLFLNVVFYLDGYIYSHEVVFDTVSPNSGYLNIKSEKLFKAKYRKSKGKKNIFLIHECGENVTKNHIYRIIPDTSSIITLTNNQINLYAFNTNNVIDFDSKLLNGTFFSALNDCDFELATNIIKLLDDGIEYIKCNDNETISYKRINTEEKTVSRVDLIGLISSGTFRGVELYIRAFDAINNGGVLIVDEIENCFQKNLVFDLLNLFFDKEINKNGAQLIFSTHFTEILDQFNRQDNIYIVHKINENIFAKKLKSYNVRTELSKGKQFDSNVFNTSLNYKQLMKVRRSMKNALYTNND